MSGESQIILETRRLILRQWCAADEAPLHAICSDPHVMAHVADGSPWRREETRRFIEDAIATQQKHGYCRWPIIFREDGALVGFCGFVPAENGAEIGWRLASKYWGLGLATEAAQAVLQYGFKILGIPQVWATVQSGNDASLRVAEKIGMTLQDRIEQNGRQKFVFVARNESNITPS